MKRWILLICLLFANIAGAETFEQYLLLRPTATVPLGIADRVLTVQGGKVKLAPVTPVVQVAAFGNLSSAKAALGSAKATLQYGTDQTVNNLTIPSNIELSPVNGALITVASGKTLTYSGSVSRWPLSQVFSGAGAVTGLKESMPEWFGGRADNSTPSGAAITKALAALIPGGKLTLQSGTYLCEDAQIDVATNRVEIAGNGVGTVIKRTVGDIMYIHGTVANRATDYSTGNFANHIQFPHIHHLAFDGGNHANGYAAIKEEVVYQARYDTLFFDNINKGVSSFGSFQSQYLNFRNTLARTDSITVDYGFYCDLSAQSPAYQTGDLLFDGWQTKAIKSHIYAKGSWTGSPNPGASNLIDGANVRNSIFYNGEHGVWFTANTWADVTNNKFFAHSYDPLILDTTRTMQVVGNNMTWNTFNSAYDGTAYGHGIKIVGDPSNAYTWAMDTKASNNQIANNIIYQVNGSGIYATNQYGLQITGNKIYGPNYDGFFRTGVGQPYLGTYFSQDGIHLEGCIGGKVEGNSVNPDWITTNDPGNQFKRNYRWDVFVDATNRNVTVSHDKEYEAFVALPNTLTATDSLYANTNRPASFLNYCAFPEQMNGWTPVASGGASVPGVSSFNSVASPEGDVTADTINLPATTTAQSSIVLLAATPTLAPATGKTVTFSIYLRADADSTIQMGVSDTVTGTVRVRTFHLGTTWKRYWFTHTYDTAIGNVDVFIGHIYQTNAAKDIYAWGGQIEYGDRMNSYIRKIVYAAAMPTTGAWRVGDMVSSTDTSASPNGWRRLTTGTNNVLNTDWTTGFPSALPNGTTATTQTPGDNSTKIATDAYVDAGLATKEPIITAGTTAQYLRGDKSLGTLNQAAVAGLTTASSPTFAGVTATTFAGNASTATALQNPRTINGTSFNGTANIQTSIAGSSDYTPLTTWTPVITFATPGNLSVVYSIQYGWYTKRGKQVTAYFSVATSTFTWTTASGALNLTGLPSPSATSTNTANYAAEGALRWQGITKASYTSAVCEIGANANLIRVLISGSGQATAAVAAADMPSGGTVSLIGSVTYETD